MICLGKTLSPSRGRADKRNFRYGWKADVKTKGMEPPRQLKEGGGRTSALV